MAELMLDYERLVRDTVGHDLLLRRMDALSNDSADCGVCPGTLLRTRFKPTL